MAQQVESHGAKDGTKDGTKDNKLVISTISDIDDCLRSLDDQRWTQVESEIRNRLDKTTRNILKYCIEPKTREEIFSYIRLYNNNRNFIRHVKPIIELDWLQLTIPDKPTSKNQKYITSDIAWRLVEPENTGIKRIPVASSNIASVGYDADNKILEIELHHGVIYRYFGVPKEEYEAIMSASSYDSYTLHIRWDYLLHALVYCVGATIGFMLIPVFRKLIFPGLIQAVPVLRRFLNSEVSVH